MQNTMVIEHDSGKREHYKCPCFDCKGSSSQVIPKFYSFKHAIKNGWVLTKEIKYCPPDQKTVFVCPKCYEHTGNV